MKLDDLEYFMDIARTFNNVPKNGNGIELCSFDKLPSNVEARHYTDGAFQYVIIDSAFNKSQYQLDEFAYLMGLFVHEYRHLWQENYDTTHHFLDEIKRTNFDTYHETWIDHEFEQDAEAIKYLFYTDVLKMNLNEAPKFKNYDENIKSKIIALMGINRNFVNAAETLEKIKASKEPLKKYIKNL